MSEDRVCNYVTDPACVKPVGTWRMHVDGLDDDGKRIYALDNSAQSGMFFAFVNSGIVLSGVVVCAHVDCETMGKIRIEGQESELYRADGWLIGRTGASSNVNLHCSVGCAPVTLLHSGVYTLDDWQVMQSHGVIWFDGDSIDRGTLLQ